MNRADSIATTPSAMMPISDHFCEAGAATTDLASTQARKRGRAERQDAQHEGVPHATEHPAPVVHDHGQRGQDVQIENSSPVTAITSSNAFCTDVVSRYTAVIAMSSRPTMTLAATGVEYRRDTLLRNSGSTR